MALADPFSFEPKNKEPMTKEELLLALRADIASEIEAIQFYTAHAARCSDPKLKQGLLDIADEEKKHIGELQRWIEYLDPAEPKLWKEGAGEVEDILQEPAKEAAYSPPPDIPPSWQAPALTRGLHEKIQHNLRRSALGVSEQDD